MLNYQQAFVILQPLFFFLIGISVYAIFIFKFYRFVAKKDIFDLNLQQYATSEHSTLKKISEVFYYVLEYILLFPIFTFFWLLMLTLFLILLSKNPVIENVLLVSVALVCAIRVTAYYNEDLSKDLAKMLPFALLGIFIIDISYFSLEKSIETIQNFPNIYETIIYYYAFVMILEFFLRTSTGIIHLFKPEKTKNSD